MGISLEPWTYNMKKRHARRIRTLTVHLCGSSEDTYKHTELATLILKCWCNDPQSRDRLTEKLLMSQTLTLTDATKIISAIFSATTPQYSLLGGIAGYKLGWKAFFPEKHALFAPVFRNGMISSSDSISLSKHHIFSAEAEFGLVLHSSFKARNTVYSQEEVWRHVSHIELCIELCGARQTTTKNPLHYVADGLLGAAIVRGPKISLPINPASLTDVEVKLFIAGVEINKGTAKNNPCDSPLASLTYLVNERCVKEQLDIDSGSLVIAGHCCQAGFANRPAPPFVNIPLGNWEQGDGVLAVFDGLGEVEATLLT